MFTLDFVSGGPIVSRHTFWLEDLEKQKMSWLTYYLCEC
jgi:hypothetical protein